MPDTGYVIDDIIKEYQPKIHRYLRRLVGENEAEDLSQEVLIKINRSISDFDGRSKLSTWIYRIATNTAIDRLRSSSYKQLKKMISEDVLAAEDQTEIGESKVLSADQNVIEKEMNACIKNFVNNLSDNYRTVLALSEFENLKNQEIADILGITLETVKIRLHRARARLKKELNRHCDFYRSETL